MNEHETERLFSYLLANCGTLFIGFLLVNVVRRIHHTLGHRGKPKLQLQEQNSPPGVYLAPHTSQGVKGNINYVLT